MNTTSTRSQSVARPQRPARKPSPPVSIESIRERVEQHVKENPLKAVGQAVAAGYVLRFLPMRAILSTIMRLAPPVMLLNRMWAQPKPPKDE